MPALCNTFVVLNNLQDDLAKCQTIVAAGSSARLRLHAWLGLGHRHTGRKVMAHNHGSKVYHVHLK